MKVKVLISFSDEINKAIQPEGKIIDMTEERFQFIISKKPELIELVETDDAEFPKLTGGGWYLLSNGEKVQGKEEALKAEEELKE